MRASDLIAELLNSAEKAAEMARVIRREETLFQLLIEEKTGNDKGRRFGFDFKTLADVLIQEMIKHDLELKFSGLGKRVAGEESNKFTNTVGETVNLEIKDNKKKTLTTLMKVLDGNERAATVLANLVHSEVNLSRSENIRQFETIELDKKSIGIWIDPIDGTAEYITGNRDPEFNPGKNISQHGLPNVTVLIGVYEKSSGEPIIGVVNQPFFRTSDGKLWTGRTVWGACVQNKKCVHIPDSLSEVQLSREEQKHCILTSMSDCKKLGTYLCEKFELITAPGAGYKLLCVIDRLVSAYVLSKDNTYRWDTCAPHAILRAMGGGVVQHKGTVGADFVNQRQQCVNALQITYHKSEPKAAGSNAWCNMQGVIAYLSEDVLVSIGQCLSK